MIAPDLRARQYKRYQPMIGNDAEIFIPRDGAPGTREQRIRRAVRWLWSRGIYPGPAALSLRLHGHTRGSRTLNGVETKLRNEMLESMNIGRQRAPCREAREPSVLGSWSER
jgi:hypothetical protein